MSVWIEESPSNRATCPRCDLFIKKGELRVGGNMGSGTFPHYYHLNCWLKENSSFVKDFLRIILPKVFGDDVAEPLLITLELKGGLE
jgi:hypothetical protein